MKIQSMVSYRLAAVPLITVTALSLLVVSCGGGLVSRLTATGVTTCGDYSIVDGGDLDDSRNSETASNYENCNSDKDAEGDPIPKGQDGHILAGVPMQYTLLTRKGDECVRDEATGLIWEQKTNDGGLRDKTHTYSWYNPDPKTNGTGAVGGDGSGEQNKGVCKGSACDTLAYVKALNDANYCGYADWRMPKIIELQSIVDYGRTTTGITINPIFKNSTSGWYSVAEPFSSSLVYAIEFTEGTIGTSKKSASTANNHIRVVRGSYLTVIN